MEIVVAERRFQITMADGTQHPARLQLTRPEKIADRTWACSARLGGLDGHSRDTIGVDSWQALTVAVALVRKTLSDLAADGASFHWEAGGEPLELDDLFPQFD